MQKIGKELAAYSPGGPTSFPNLEDMTRRMSGRFQSSKDGPLREFLGGSGLAAFFNKNAERVLVDHDCHKGNFVRQKDGALYKIDISPVWAPPLYQAASVAMAADLLDTPGGFPQMEAIQSLWPEVGASREDFLCAMKLKACLSMDYFDRLKEASCPAPSAEIIREKYWNGFLSVLKAQPAP